MEYNVKEVLEAEVDALEVWLAAPSVPEDVRVGMEISLDKIKRLLE